MCPSDYRTSRFSLIDRPEHDENPNLGFVLTETVRAIEGLRRVGRTVLLHCVGAYSRTPTVAALYGARLRNVEAREGAARRHGSAPESSSQPDIPRSVAPHRMRTASGYRVRDPS
jgi:hypothetical protein